MDLVEIAREVLTRAVGGVIGQFWVPGSRVFFVYLIGALVIVVALWLADRGRRAGGFRALVGFLFPGRVWWHPSARVDYAFFVVSTALFSMVFIFAYGAGGEAISDAMALIRPPRIAAIDGVAADLIITLAVVLTIDFTIFAVHTAFHKVPLLWQFHKVHHSARVLVPFTLYRAHPVEQFANAMAAGVTVGAVRAGLGAFVVEGGSEFTISGLNVVLFLFYLLGYNLRHSHIWLSYPPWLSHILVSPAQHQIHHSCRADHLDKNMGLVFAFWDWAARSLYVPRGREYFRMGLVDGEDEEFSSVLALYFLPFLKAWRLIAAPGNVEASGRDGTHEQ